MNIETLFDADESASGDSGVVKLSGTPHARTSPHDKSMVFAVLIGGSATVTISAGLHKDDPMLEVAQVTASDLIEVKHMPFVRVTFTGNDDTVTVRVAYP